MPITELYENRPVELSGIRIHELAVQRWLYDNFHVVEGYPVPVVFTTPMDAYSHFKNLWASEANNPFKHLLDAKDANGTPLYEPFPSPARYPIFSVFRKGWKYRTEQNYSYHRWRNLSWTTVAKEGIKRGDLGTAATAYMPMAWTFMFQLDFFCLRPDTMSIFVRHLMRKLYRTGGIPQTWLMAAYPFYGPMLNRMTLDGDIAYLTPEEPEEGKNVEYRVSVNLSVEGFEMDLDIQELPTLWQLVLSGKAPLPFNPAQLQTIFNITSELREAKLPEANPNVNLRLQERPLSIPDY